MDPCRSSVPYITPDTSLKAKAITILDCLRFVSLSFLSRLNNIFSQLEFLTSLGALLLKAIMDIISPLLQLFFLQGKHLSTNYKLRWAFGTVSECTCHGGCWLAVFLPTFTLCSVTSLNYLVQELVLLGEEEGSKNGAPPSFKETRLSILWRGHHLKLLSKKQLLHSYVAVLLPRETWEPDVFSFLPKIQKISVGN